MSKMKRPYPKPPKVDPTKKTYVTLMYVAQAYPRCRKMWNYHHDTFGDVYGFRSWYGYDWYSLNNEKKAWTYLFRTWVKVNKVPVFTIEVKAKSFKINTPPKD